jgi:hypothetical protein
VAAHDRAQIGPHHRNGFVQTSPEFGLDRRVGLVVPTLRPGQCHPGGARGRGARGPAGTLGRSETVGAVGLAGWPAGADRSGRTRREVRAAAGRRVHAGAGRGPRHRTPGCRTYEATNPPNRVLFSTAAEAEAAGYRTAGSCP